MSERSKQLTPVSKAIQALDAMREAKATSDEIGAFVQGDDRQTVADWCHKYYPDLVIDLDAKDQGNDNEDDEAPRSCPEHYVLLLDKGCPRLFTLRPSRQETARTSTGNAVVEVPGIQVRGVLMPHDKRAAIVHVANHPAVRRAQFPVTKAELCELIEATSWFAESRIVTLAEYNEQRDLEREAKEAVARTQADFQAKLAAKRGKRGQAA